MAKHEIKNCSKHGDVKFVLEGRGYFRCTACRVDAVVKRRKKIKLLSVEYKGGKCHFCGYNKCVEALDFHHLDANKKDFGIAYKGHTKSFDKIRSELDKCVLVCSNCHREIHAGLIQW